jgi:FtsZ-interacting cell division protein ZipA
MRIINELDLARDIALPGGFIHVEAGDTVDLADHLPADDATALGERLCEQDGWSQAARGKRTKPKPDTSAADDAQHAAAADADAREQALAALHTELDELRGRLAGMDETDPQRDELTTLIAESEQQLTELEHEQEGS